MKSFNLTLLLSLAPLLSSHAQEARFFRIVGPVASAITAFSPDGYVTWTNAPTNATFTVQTALSLLSQTNWADYAQVPVTNPVTICRLFDPNAPSNMVFIPAGSFQMGDNLDGDTNSLPVHTVNVSACYMDKYEVTKALWGEVYQWATNHGYSFDKPGIGDADHPVHSINWYDMVKWCNARSEKEGKTPAYYTSAAQTGIFMSGQTNVQNDWVKWNAGYRLPTEAEWQKAARGGTSGHRFPWADADTIAHSRTTYVSQGTDAYDVSPTRGVHPTFGFGTNAFGGTSPVGYFAPNGYGLYEMAGNVAEWCWDWYASYSVDLQTDPHGPDSGSNRIECGGGWNWTASSCRVSFRFDYGMPPLMSYGDYGIGFRTVLPSAQ